MSFSFATFNLCSTWLAFAGAAALGIIFTLSAFGDYFVSLLLTHSMRIAPDTGVTLVTFTDMHANVELPAIISPF